MDRDEATLEREARAAGSKGIALGIGLIAFVVLVMLPFLIPVVFYVAVNVYAMVKGTTFSAGTANEGVLLTLLVLAVALFPVLLAALVGFIGRSLSPKHERD